MVTCSKHRSTTQSLFSNPIALTLEDFYALSAQAQEQGEAIFQQAAFETQANLPSVLGDGGDRYISLRNGLDLYIRNAKLWRPLHLERSHDAEFPLTATFYLSGGCRVKTQGVSDIEPDYTEIAGCNYLYHLPNLAEVEEWPSNEVIHGIMLCAPIDYFQLSYADESLSQPLRRLLEGDRSQRFHQALGRITATMHRVLQQILQAPYAGLTQQLYLESKALELLALQFSQWSGDSEVQRRSRRLSPQELDQLHAAKDLLVNDMSNTPTLGAIAQHVGLSEHRLKQGFRQVFGTTPFGYLHHHRMQLAQELLLHSNLSVAGVAARVGYRNPEAFSTAFRRKFGIAPKAHQLGRCN